MSHYLSYNPVCVCAMCVSVGSEKVRYWSISILGVVAGSCKQAIYRSLALLLPNDERDAVSSRPFAGPSLVTCFLNDPMPRVPDGYPL